VELFSFLANGSQEGIDNRNGRAERIAKVDSDGPRTANSLNGPPEGVVTMTTLTIELPDTFTVAMRNGASVEIETAKIAGLGAELLAYGIGQKVRDSASAASTVANETKEELVTVAQGMMDKAVASLYAGEWSHRGEGTGADPRTLVARSIVRKAIKENVGSKSPEWAKFTGLSDKDQLAKLDETYSANAELFDPLIDAEIKRRADANKAKAKAASALEINL
jgi:hypothetical protein